MNHEKKIFAAWIIVLFLFCLSLAFSDGAEKELTDNNEWEVYSEDGDYAGILRKENGRLIFYNNDDVTLKKQSEFVWEIYNQKDKFQGKIEKHSRDSYITIYDKNNNELGIIFPNKDFKAKGTKNEIYSFGSQNNRTRFKRHKVVKITPETIDLYIHVLKALETIQ